MSSSRLPVVSFFTGGGGLDLGFYQAGFKTIYAADHDLSAVSTFNKNTGNNNTACQLDLSVSSIDQILKLIEDIGVTPVGAIGGPPCQGFSRANCSSYAADPRNALPLKYVDIIIALKEKFEIDFFVFENVPGIRDVKHQKVFSSIKEKLLTGGFNLFEKELNASWFGVPQQRRRIFFVGINSEKKFKNAFTFPEGCEDNITVYDAIGHLPEPVFFSRGLNPNNIPFHSNHWTMRPKSRKFKDGVKPGGRSFKLLYWDRKSPTVAYGNREIHIHPNGKRRLSIFEAMLLQGFPSDYVLTGSLSKQVEQVSNAVPPPVAKAIASAIKQAIGLNAEQSFGDISC
ncbi:MAG TPA: DNA (cytosine-5-)-methyltransferase [Desulfobulbaceae bacterium]|nr:DNA (cytosine-5-)-methyltransferase [Desulfobulbaceae bacterium]